MQIPDPFTSIRQEIVGIDLKFRTPCGEKTLLYADWTASGRLYRPIEQRLSETIGPYVGNTHSELSVTGTCMTRAYHHAQNIIKKHVNAAKDDVLIHTGFGMTAAVNKFQRLLGLKIPEQFCSNFHIPDPVRPLVLITHMEHHSNQTSWLETIAEVVVLPPGPNGLVDLDRLEDRLKKYRDRPLKFGAFTACSNVTGIRTPVHQMASLMHRYGGYCFVDYAACAPYDSIDMHPADPMEKLDAIYFSPHKFLGGPGSSGVLIFDSQLYRNRVPDQPGGGTVEWTNPWGEHRYVADIEVREDGGTPGFLQSIRAALAVRLKEQMGVDAIHQREAEWTARLFSGLRRTSGLHLLADSVEERLGIFSFFLDSVHYSLAVKLLNDRFGIQVRGGCSCAGTYGHYLLHVDPNRSKKITDKIDHGDLSDKPGWVRLSVHPTTTEEEIDRLIDALHQITKHGEKWEKEYVYSRRTNEFHHHRESDYQTPVESWFDLSE
ncbi:MAG TPA: aminotransferase class V-fold PLP-dependent enzyme [bacterium]|nr:aminotransferase class V-fold PLP-dependent enzyme [bacterium]HPG45678.1 aminotransferase class V-fold PLP-dependent enzyme [bacterium]HPM97543.1 aminotransferase class V-fold PLP-dependent enzyme [bacterium]